MRARVSKTQRPPDDLVAGLFGARGSGKSHTVWEYLERERPARLLIMDPMDEYSAHATRVATLAELVQRSRGQAFALRYVPPDLEVCSAAELADRFTVFCQLAWKRTRLVMVVEEAQLFTRASQAPPAWRACTLRGRHRGVRIFAISQRPAHIDKDLFTNATWLRTGRLNFEDDVVTMARSLRVPRHVVEGLVGREWIARNTYTGTLLWDPPELFTRPRALEGGAIAGVARANARSPASLEQKRLPAPRKRGGVL